MQSVAPILLAALLVATARGEDKRKPNFTVGKETTYVLGPVGKDGRIDYAAALNERMGKGVTAETNANVLIWKALGPKPEGGNGMAAKFFKLLGIAEPTETDIYIDIGKFLREQLAIDDPEQTEDIFEQLGPAGRYPFSPKQRPYIADWLKANEKPIAIVVEGMKRPHFYSPVVPGKTDKGISRGLISILLPAAQKCRSLATALTCRAMLRMDERKYDEAWQDLLACHRLARHVARGSTLIEELVALAIENIALRSDQILLDTPGIDSKRLLGYLRDFQDLPAMPTVADRIDLGERFMYLDTLMLIDRTGFDILREFHELPADVPIPTGELTSVNWDAAMRSANRYFDELVAALRVADHEKREKELDRLEEDLKARKKQVGEANELGKAIAGVGIAPEERGKILGEAMLTEMAPSVRKLSTAFDRTEQGQRNIRLGFALAAYQRDNGRYPKSLDDVAPKYLKAIPNDLFTGKPLIYRPHDKGFLLYSFGPNGKDDEGRWYDDEPRGDDPNVRVPVVRK